MEDGHFHTSQKRAEPSVEKEDEFRGPTDFRRHENRTPAVRGYW